MKTSEIAKSWDVKPRWVSDRCNEVMIPLARKKPFGWDIPEEATKPPCTGRFAAGLLKAVQSCANGIEVNLFPSGKTKALEAYRYLVEWGYISLLDCTSVESIRAGVQEATITDIGNRLINKNQSSKTTADKKGQESATVVSVY